MKLKNIFVILLSVLSFSCRWEKVDYGLSDDSKSLNDKIASINIHDIGVQALGTTNLVLPIEIEGLYKDADKYMISDINSLMKVFYKSASSGKMQPVEAMVSRRENLVLEVTLPMLVADGSILLFVDGEKKAEQVIKVADVVWAVDQTNGDADSWSDRAKIHFKVERTKANESLLSSSLEATIVEENGTEVRKLDINPNAEEETIEIDNLKPSTTYVVTYSLNGTEKSISKKIRTEDVLQLPNASFEQWSEMKRQGAYWELAFPFPENTVNTPHWDTLNRLTCRYGLDANQTNLRYRANSSTIPTDKAHSGSKAALVRTVAYGANATSAGSWSLHVTVSLGSLYLGEFNDAILNDGNLLPHLGIPFASRPRALSFWAKYRPKNELDRFYAEIVFVDSSGNRIAEGVLPSEDSGRTGGDGYEKFVIPIQYSATNVKPSKMYVRFLSGNRVDDSTSNIDYGFAGNGSEHVGSMLYVDDVELIY